jgi:hypothetical protein
MGDRTTVDPPYSSSTIGLSSSLSYEISKIGGAVSGSLGLLEAERWMLSVGVMRGEMRDEIFCQTIKQLSNNPDP